MANDQGTFLAFNNWLEDSTVTYSTTSGAQTVATLGPENLALSESDNFWRVLSVSSNPPTETLTIDRGANTQTSAISLQFPRGEYPGVSEDAPAYGPSDTLRIRLYDTDDQEVYDSGTFASAVVAGFMTAWVKLPAPVQASRVVLDFVATSRAASWFDLSSVGLWRDLVDFSVGFSYPAGDGWQPNNESNRTPAGRLYTNRFEPLRRWSLTFDFLNNTDAEGLDECIRYAGGSRQVFIRRGDRPSGKDAMHALMTTNRPMESRTPTIRQQALTFDEFI